MIPEQYELFDIDKGPDKVLFIGTAWIVLSYFFCKSIRAPLLLTVRVSHALTSKVLLAKHENVFG